MKTFTITTKLKENKIVTENMEIEYPYKILDEIMDNKDKYNYKVKLKAKNKEAYVYPQ